jgi:hypothetical protein
MLTRIAAALAACALMGPAHADNGKVIACVKQALAQMEAAPSDSYEAFVHQTEIELCATVDPSRQKRLRWALAHQAE